MGKEPLLTRTGWLFFLTSPFALIILLISLDKKIPYLSFIPKEFATSLIFFLIIPIIFWFYFEMFITLKVYLFKRKIFKRDVLVHRSLFEKFMALVIAIVQTAFLFWIIDLRLAWIALGICVVAGFLFPTSKIKKIEYHPKFGLTHHKKGDLFPDVIYKKEAQKIKKIETFCYYCAGISLAIVFSPLFVILLIILIPLKIKLMMS